MQTESGMQLILLGGPPLKSETLMGLSIDGVSRMRQVVLVPVVGQQQQQQHERCQQGQSPPVALYILQYLFALF